MRTFFLTIGFLLAILSASAQTPTTRTHVVQRGETLELIATNYGVSESSILESNPMAKEMFFIGMKLTIPTSISATATADAQLKISDDGQSEEKTAGKEKTMTATDGDYQTGLSIYGISASYYFPVKKEPSSEAGHYKASYELSFEANGIYRFPHRVFTKFGLGVLVAGANASDEVQGGFRYVQSEVSYVHLYAPIRVGYQIPLWKRSHLDVHTGARLSCLVGGYEKHRSNTNEEWVKTKVKDMENPKRFHAYWTLGADLNFGGFAIGCEYLHTLEHKPMKGLDKGAIAATLSLLID